MPTPIIACDASTRFTLFSTICFRFERGGVWEDRPSFAFANRTAASIEYDVRNSSAGCNITVRSDEERLELSYARPIGMVEARRYTSGANPVVWRLGDAQTQSLGGTVFSLSGVTNATTYQFPLAPLNCSGSQRTSNSLCTAGVLSTAGWAAYDDTDNQVRTPSGDWAPSVHAGRAGHADLTVFVYGREYRRALAELAVRSGAPLLPPRRFFGVWWSRWQKYSQGDFEALARAYEDAALPLDGINIDTEWHRNTDYLDGPEASPGGGSKWYSGVYDWDESLYPSVPRMVSWLRARGLWPVWVDIHQASGVTPHNSRYAEFARALGADAAANATFATEMANTRPSARRGSSCSTARRAARRTGTGGSTTARRAAPTAPTGSRRRAPPRCRRCRSRPSTRCCSIASPSSRTRARAASSAAPRSWARTVGSARSATHSSTRAT